ncbi:CRISPR system Cascade subunit CasE [Propionibacterium cyclohexanicum]|uniref:CRISPR system Cascade subunit CasE n=1 Tax=Propionibacterium cyclohexanicum TaxID=64702 RepID=A0A1H9U4T4_9ACTN|nr:type I-E CRISPR-associated protein Cas6/Cse3/CasE [Propionibacterium cyclohexanicum]SES04446.1 CRISPR system Cascade subunit CasE [Propionibacterium cyclohexanicum]
MFLTQFDINTGRRSAQRLIGSAERIHAAVLGCFPPGQYSADDARTLWRLDRGPSNHQTSLMIVSPLRPDLTALNEQAGWDTGSAGRSADYGAFLAGLSAGRVWRFRLTANPTVSLKRPGQGGQRGKRHAHVTAGQQLEWLLKRAARYGFTIPLDDDGQARAQVTGRDVLRFRRGPGATGRIVTVATATYDGVLEVNDPNLLRAVLTNGIGPAKGYGCGLLTLAPPH